MASTVADKLGTGDGNGTRRRNRRDLSTRSEVSTGLRESAGGCRVRGRTTGGRNESAADGPSRGGSAVVSPACRPHRRPGERLKELVRAGRGVYEYELKLLTVTACEKAINLRSATPSQRRRCRPRVAPRRDTTRARCVGGK